MHDIDYEMEAVMAETREAAMEWWIDNRTISHAGPSDGFLAGWDAAKSEPVSIDREALFAVLRDNYLYCDEDPPVYELVDAVIAHLAAGQELTISEPECQKAHEIDIAAQPVTAAVEWGVLMRRGNRIVRWSNQEKAAAFAALTKRVEADGKLIREILPSDPERGRVLVTRTKSAWTEVNA